MSRITKFVGCSDEQFEDFVKNGKTIVNGVEKPYEPDTTFYITPATGGYPVGSIYMSVSSTSPASLFGGTWEQIKDKFLLASGSSYTAGASGGSASVEITTDNLPASRLAISSNATGAEVKVTGIAWGEQTVSAGSYVVTQYTRLGKLGQTARYTATPLDNMPPYLAVYVWKRVA